MEQGAERSLETLALMLDRLAGAASLLEQTVSRLEEQHLTMSGQVQKIVATVEQAPNTVQGGQRAHLRIGAQAARSGNADRGIAGPGYCFRSNGTQDCDRCDDFSAGQAGNFLA